MRGKAFAPIVHTGSSGITPAYAGKSFQSYPLMHVWQDHPRLCGEKPGKPFRGRSKLGSPPPMRGKAKNDDLETYIA